MSSESAVSRYIEQQRLRAALADQGAEPEGRVTIRLDPVRYLKLLRLAGQFGATKSSIASDLLAAAVDDAWELRMSEEQRRYEELAEGPEWGPEDEARWLLKARDADRGDDVESTAAGGKRVPVDAGADGSGR